MKARLAIKVSHVYRLDCLILDVCMKSCEVSRMCAPPVNHKQAPICRSKPVIHPHLALSSTRTAQVALCGFSTLLGIFTQVGVVNDQPLLATANNG
jgi:hypothetical protein